LEDSVAAVRDQYPGFADDAFTRASFQNIALNEKISDSIER